MFIQKRQAVKPSKRIIMSGATSGYGQEVAIRLAAEGHLIIVLARDLDKLTQLQVKFEKRYPRSCGGIQGVYCNLASFQSVKDAVQFLVDEYFGYDYLICNAGVWNKRYKSTVDNIEESLQVNLLSPLLLSYLLYPELRRMGEGHIIYTVDKVWEMNMDVANLECHPDNYSADRAYFQSKLALIFITRHFSHLLYSKDISIFCQYPGEVISRLRSNGSWLDRFAMFYWGKRHKKGAKTILYLLDNVREDLVTGEMYENASWSKLRPYTYDMEIAREVMRKVIKYLDLHADFSPLKVNLGVE